VKQGEDFGGEEPLWQVAGRERWFWFGKLKALSLHP